MNWIKIHQELFTNMNELYSKGTEGAREILEDHAQENVIIDCVKKHNLVVTALDEFGAALLLQHKTDKNGGIITFIVHPTQTSQRVDYVVFMGPFSSKFYKNIMESKHFLMRGGKLWIDIPLEEHECRYCKERSNCQKVGTYGIPCFGFDLDSEKYDLYNKKSKS